MLDMCWKVNTAGYEWVEGWRGGHSNSTKPEWLLAEKVSTRRTREKYYNPFASVENLFGTLATTEPTPDGILRFANHYGFLGYPATAGFQVVDAANDVILGSGEPLSSWQEEIAALNTAYSLGMKAIQDKRKSFGEHSWVGRYKTIAFERSFGSSSPPAQTNDFNLAGLFPKRPGWSSPSISRICSEDPYTMAWGVLQQVINFRLADLVATQMLWEADLSVMKLHITPRSLLGAAWLQLALACSDERKAIECAGCGQQFWLGMSRSDKKHCSNACRTRAHRQRS